MLRESKPPVHVEFRVDDAYMEQFARNYLKELFDRCLKPQWLTMSDMEFITRRKRAWIMKYIVGDPYVRQNGLAKKEGGKNGKWTFDAVRIRPFLNKLFDELPEIKADEVK